MKSDQLQCAVIGAGIMGKRHAAWLNGDKRTDVTAIADNRESAAADLASKVEAESYADYNRMLSEEKFDIVVVATPDPLHLAPVLACCKAGAPNIILEKPMATTVEGAKAMLDAAAKSNTKIFLNFANRFNPMDMTLRYTVQNGLIGDPVYGESRLDDNISVPTTMWGDRTKEWAGGSSTARFLLSHAVDLLRWYFAPAEVEAVYAISQQKLLGYCPDVYDAFLFFDTGLKVRVKAEWIKRIKELVEFYQCYTGSTGQIIYNKIPGYGTARGIKVNIDDENISLADVEAHQNALREKGILVSIASERETQTGQCKHRKSIEVVSEIYSPQGGNDSFHYFVQSILEDDAEPTDSKGFGPVPTGEDGLKQTAVVCAIEESAQQQVEVKVEY